jgi:hypothetical protein
VKISTICITPVILQIGRLFVFVGQSGDWLAIFIFRSDRHVTVTQCHVTDKEEEKELEKTDSSGIVRDSK